MKSIIYFIAILSIGYVYTLYKSELYALHKVNNTFDSTIKIYIGKILITGNDITEDDVILRELETREEGLLDTEKLKRDMQRLYNLNLFNKVDIFPVLDKANIVNLIIDVNEQFYFLPIPQGGLKEGSFKKLWGGMNIIWRNFQGLNHTTGLSFGIGYEPFISFYYINPWIFGDNRYFYNFETRYSRNVLRNPNSIDTALNTYTKDNIPTYNNNNFATRIVFGKFLNPNFSAGLGIQYDYVETSKYIKGNTVSKDGSDSYLSGTLLIRYDTRDYNRYSLFGSYYDLSLNRYGILSDVIDINKVRIDLRRFIPVIMNGSNLFSFNARLLTAFSFGGGEIPVYLKENFGYSDIIRGWNDYIFEGDNKIGFFTEVRIPILTPKIVDGKDHILFNKIKLLRNYSYRYGLYVTLFFDTGTTCEKNENLFNKKFRGGYGLGLNLLLPFEIIGRIDYGLRKSGGRYFGQFIFSLDSAF